NAFRWWSVRSISWIRTSSLSFCFRRPRNLKSGRASLTTNTSQERRYSSLDQESIRNCALHSLWNADAEEKEPILHSLSKRTCEKELIRGVFVRLVNDLVLRVE